MYLFYYRPRFYTYSISVNNNYISDEKIVNKKIYKEKQAINDEEK